MALRLACDEQALLETTACVGSIWDRSFTIWMDVETTARSERCPQSILCKKNLVICLSVGVLIWLLKRLLNGRHRHHLLVGHEGVLLER